MKQLIQAVRKEKQTQLFIEAPYRNNPMRDALIASVPKDISVLVVTDVMFESQKVQDVRSEPELHKKPAIFLLT